EIAQLLDLSPAEVHDTMTFYGFFRPKENPLGRTRVWVCRSLPCMLKGGEELLGHLCDKLGLEPGKTTADGAISLEFAECIGACGKGNDASPGHSNRQGLVLARPRRRRFPVRSQMYFSAQGPSRSYLPLRQCRRK